MALNSYSLHTYTHALNIVAATFNMLCTAFHHNLWIWIPSCKKGRGITHRLQFIEVSMWERGRGREMYGNVCLRGSKLLNTSRLITFFLLDIHCPFVLFFVAVAVISRTKSHIVRQFVEKLLLESNQTKYYTYQYFVQRPNKIHWHNRLKHVKIRLRCLAGKQPNKTMPRLTNTFYENMKKLWAPFAMEDYPAFSPFLSLSLSDIINSIVLIQAQTPARTISN